uniref:Uncharacterized protein LOC111123472 isoform X2 n=1 Tax=Crassostrea virginica TaxID=6565 RepID=A0A8B8D1X9_CRAVI|nr:uncharacterized protein LOC111123472 isoform X2 [Crassostrea virginica]
MQCALCKGKPLMHNVLNSFMMVFGHKSRANKCHIPCKMSFTKSICLVHFVILLGHVQMSVSQDPCSDGNTLELDNLAKRSSSYAVDSTPLCDRYIREAWYTTQGYVMTMSPPSLTYCGTLYPVWLSDNIPSDQITQTLTACEVGFFGNCSRSYQIDVKNCTTFLAYKLKALDVCNSAYCFELNDHCIAEKVDNIKVSFHNITWRRSEVSGVIKYDPYINLLCSFTPSANETLLYHIDWYVDNETVIQGQTVDKDSLQDAILSAEDLINAGKKINSWIHCVVGVKMLTNKNPCFSSPSELFFAGIEVLNNVLTIERNGKGTLEIRLTIPFASETIETENGQFAAYLDISLFFPKNENCTNYASTKFTNCKTRINSYRYDERHHYTNPANWRTVYYLDVFNSDEEAYYLTHQKSVLRLATNNATGGAKIFAFANLHDVRLNFVDKDSHWKGKQCHSRGDPHQRTFDGYFYECQAKGCVAGKTYILYRNEQLLQEVQVRHDICGTMPRCVCAVAARAGQDVFTIDFCNGKEIINFPLCNENSLKVIKIYDKVYKIIFPSGTHILVEFAKIDTTIWYSNVYIYPSESDVSRTSGLCGSLDSNETNDLRRRNGFEDNITLFNHYNPPDNFSLSWQLSRGSTEDLLSYSPSVFKKLTSLSTQFHKLCTCESVDKIHCNYKQYNECTTKSRGKEYHCVIHNIRRKRRDLKYLTNIEKNREKTVKLRRFERQVNSETEAFDICNEAFQQSGYYVNCLQVVPTFNNQSLVNCISDVFMTGNPNFTQWNLDTALRECQTGIQLNSTVQKEHTEVSTFIVNLCPNNCSNKGVCRSGNCTCEYGFGGSDCSFDVLSLPTIVRLSDNGICDKSEETCDDITVYGRYFLENMGTTCYVTREEINENNSVLLTTNYSIEFEERTMFEGYCTLYYGSYSPWITRFLFSLSNDGSQFSESYSVYVYQSVCQTFQNDSGDIHFTLQTGYCYINGRCIQSGTFKHNNTCLQCQPRIDVYEWIRVCNDNVTPGDSTVTWITTSDINKTQKMEDKLSEGETIGLIVAAAFVSIITFVLVVVMLKNRIKRHETGYLSDNNRQNELCIYPQGENCKVTKGIFNPAYLLHFESPNEKYSKSSSSSSTRALSSTTDLSGVYDQ